MALSGTISGSTNNQYISARITWSATQNQNANTSTVTAIFEARKSSSSSAATTGNGTWYLTINGTKKTISKSMNLPNNNTWHEIGRNTVTVNHNDDGTKSISIVGSGGTSLTSWTSTSCSGTVTLDKIPRQTTPTIGSGTHYFGQDLSIGISPAKNTFTHTVLYTWNGTTTGTITSNYSSGTITWTVPANFMNDIPNTTFSSALVITVKTYDSGSLLGTTNVAVRMDVPASVIPTVTGITCTDTGNLQLIDLTKTSAGRINSSGDFESSASYTCSDFIPVVAGETINFKLLNPNGDEVWYDPTWFDEDKEYISGYADHTSTDTEISEAFTVPNGAKFVRISYSEGYSARLWWNMFIKSLSVLHVKATASGSYSSTIVSYLVEALDQSIGQNDTDVTMIDESGSVTVQVTVTDSRGRTGTATTTITVEDYEIPVVSSCTFERTNSQGVPVENGTYLRVILGCSVSSIDSHNAMTVRVYYKASSDQSRTLARTISDGSISLQGEIIMISGMDVAKTYAIEVEVQDLITPTPTKANGVLSSEGAIFSCRHGGTGVAFGRTAETAYQADFEWEIRGRNGAILDTPLLPASGGTGVTSLAALAAALLDYFHPVGSLYWSSDSTDPGTLFGGTWTAITDKFVLAAGTNHTVTATSQNPNVKNGGAETDSISVPHDHTSPNGYSSTAQGGVAINGTVSGGNGKSFRTSATDHSGTLSSNVTLYKTGSTTISATVDTMPPYTVRYCWERVA